MIVFYAMYIFAWNDQLVPIIWWNPTTYPDPTLLSKRDRKIERIYLIDLIVY